MSSSIFKTLPGLFFWQFVAVGAGFGVQIILARSLGPHDKGIVDLVWLLPVVTASVAELGLLSANTYFAGKRTFPLATLHVNSLAWSVLVGVGTFFTALAVVTIVGSPFSSLTESYFLLSLAAVFPSLYYSLWSGLMYGNERASLVYRITGITSILTLAGLGLAVALGADLTTIVEVSIGLLFLKSAVPLALMASTVSFPRFDTAAFRQSIRYGIALFTGLALNILHMRMGLFFVESMLGPKELGYLVLAVRIAEMIWLLDFVLINASVFRITASNIEESTRITQRMTRVIGALILFVSILTALSSPLLIPALFGPEFSPAILPFLLFLPGIVAWSFARSLAQFIAYQTGRPWINTRAAAAVLVLNIALNIALIPVLGVEGASLASSVSYFANLVILSVVFRKLSGSRFLPTFIPTWNDFVLVRQMVTGFFPSSSSKKP